MHVVLKKPVIAVRAKCQVKAWVINIEVVGPCCDEMVQSFTLCLYYSQRYHCSFVSMIFCQHLLIQAIEFNFSLQ